jgi:hypothetical protein
VTDLTRLDPLMLAEARAAGLDAGVLIARTDEPLAVLSAASPLLDFINDAASSDDLFIRHLALTTHLSAVRMVLNYRDPQTANSGAFLAATEAYYTRLTAAEGTDASPVPGWRRYLWLVRNMMLAATEPATVTAAAAIAERGSEDEAWGRVLDTAVKLGRGGTPPATREEYEQALEVLLARTRPEGTGREGTPGGGTPGGGTSGAGTAARAMTAVAVPPGSWPQWVRWDGHVPASAATGDGRFDVAADTEGGGLGTARIIGWNVDRDTANAICAEVRDGGTPYLRAAPGPAA